MSTIFENRKYRPISAAAQLSSQGRFALGAFLLATALGRKSFSSFSRRDASQSASLKLGGVEGTERALLERDADRAKFSHGRDPFPRSGSSLVCP
jgi:hypothetical protein